MTPPKTGWQLAEAGMQASFNFADMDWKEAAAAALRRTAEEMPLFTVDDVDARIAKDVVTPNKSAMGWVLRTAKKNGLIINTDSVRRSNRPEQHSDVKVVWRSLIWKERAA